MTIADLLFIISIEHPVKFWLCTIAVTMLGPITLLSKVPR